MKRKWLTVAFTLTVLRSSVPGPAAAQTPINSYTVTKLGGTDSFVFGINDSGLVVGRLAGRAVIWQNGVAADLGDLPGVTGAYTSANGINSTGQIVGQAANSSGGYRAFLWTAGNGMSDLGTLGGPTSSANAVNDSGEIVGSSSLSTGGEHAFLWKNGAMVDLGVPSGFIGSVATSINASGQVAGRATDAQMRDWAFRWTPTVPNGTSGTMALLQSSPYNTASGINGTGAVVGQSIVQYASQHAFLWDNLGAHDLEGSLGSSGSIANAINGSGFAAGSIVHSYYYDQWNDIYLPVTHAFLWDSVNGMRDLSDLSGVEFYGGAATAINASGQLAVNVGLYTDTGQGTETNYTAYLLNPSPLPRPPAGFSATVGDGRVNLTWSASSGATSYTLKRAASLDGAYATIFTGSATAFTDTGLTNGNTYFYRVSAANSYGQSAENGSISARPVPIPAAPTGVTATAGIQQVTLSWNASTWADHYFVYRGSSTGSYSAGSDAIYGTTYVDAGDYDEGGNLTPLTPGVTLYYVVVAENQAGRSGYSLEVSATPLAPPPPTAPTGLTAVPGDGQIALSWNSSASAGYYSVKRSLTAAGPFTILANTNDPSFTNIGLTNGTTYYYVVSASNVGGEGPNSSVVSSVPVGPTPPAAPAGVVATAGDAVVTVKWTASTGATSYNLKRSTTSGGPYELVATGPDTTMYDSQVTNGTIYFYVVTAVNTHGESPNSVEVRATPMLPPPPAAPTGLSATGAKGKNNLKWTQSSTTGIAANRVYRATVSGGPYSLRFTSSAATTSYVDASVTAGLTYYYRVTALKGSQESAYSNQASAKAK